MTKADVYTKEEVEAKLAAAAADADAKLAAAATDADAKQAAADAKQALKVQVGSDPTRHLGERDVMNSTV